MLRGQLYRKTVDILFQAYYNDTLSHSLCTSCAVGNIIAANLGFELKEGNGEPPIIPLFVPSENGWVNKNVVLRAFSWERNGYHIANPMEPNWFKVFGNGSVNMDEYKGNAKAEIDATGYTPHELCVIEQAFESAPFGNSDEDWMFNGLVKVLEALARIHRVKDDELQNDVKPFREQYEMRLP